MPRDKIPTATGLTAARMAIATGWIAVAIRIVATRAVGIADVIVVTIVTTATATGDVNQNRTVGLKAKRE